MKLKIRILISLVFLIGQIIPRVCKSQTFVDKASLSSTENGTISAPYKTVLRGSQNTPVNGILKINTGHYEEKLTIDNPLTLIANKGKVVIGKFREIWTFRLASVVISEAQEESGDDLFFIVYGFRSRIGPTLIESKVLWNGVLQYVAEDIDCCNPVPIPSKMGAISWADVVFEGDIDSEDGGPDVLGVIVVGIERDRCPWTGIETQAREKIKEIKTELDKIFPGSTLVEILGDPEGFNTKINEAKERIENDDSGIISDILNFAGCLADEDDIIGDQVVVFVPFDQFTENPEEFQFKLSEDVDEINMSFLFEKEGARWRISASMKRTRLEAPPVPPIQW